MTEEDKLCKELADIRNSLSEYLREFGVDPWKYGLDYAVGHPDGVKEMLDYIRKDFKIVPRGTTK